MRPEDFPLKKISEAYVVKPSIKIEKKATRKRSQKGHEVFTDHAKDEFEKDRAKELEKELDLGDRLRSKMNFKTGGPIAEEDLYTPSSDDARGGKAKTPGN